jgi:TRAP-type C4-dicarboxylate transport system permease small subunit
MTLSERGAGLPTGPAPLPVGWELNRMAKLVQLELFLTRVLEAIITLFFFVILSLTITLVIMRYGFNAAIIGGNEAMNYLFIYTTALGAAVSVGKGEHIRISYFVDKLRVRNQKYIGTVNYILIAFINAVMIWYSLPWIRSAGYFESPVLRIPNWIVQLSVPIGCGLVILYCLNHIVLQVSTDKPTEIRSY